MYITLELTEFIDKGPAVCLSGVEGGHVLLGKVIWRPLKVKLILLRREKGITCLYMYIVRVWPLTVQAIASAN